jgi:hypothetical protein
MPFKEIIAVYTENKNEQFLIVEEGGTCNYHWDLKRKVLWRHSPRKLTEDQRICLSGTCGEVGAVIRFTKVLAKASPRTRWQFIPDLSLRPVFYSFVFVVTFSITSVASFVYFSFLVQSFITSF